MSDVSRLLDRLKRDCQRTTMVRPSGTMGGYFIADDDGATLHLPLIGPAHSPAVLDGVTVDELVDELIGSDFFGPTPTIGFQAGVHYILNRIGIAIPNGYGTVQRERAGEPDSIITLTADGGYIPYDGQRVAFFPLREKGATE